MSKENEKRLLTIVMDGEERQRNEGYIPKNKLTKSKNLKLETPDGKVHEIDEGWVMDSSQLKVLTGEYVALEVLTACNLKCEDFCYVLPRREFNEDDVEELKWMDTKFIEEFAHIVGYNQYSGRTRVFCITGGEPTLDMKILHWTFSTIMKYTNPLPKTDGSDRFQYNNGGVMSYGPTRIVVATNLIQFDLDEAELKKQVEPFNGGMIQGSYNSLMKKWYRRIATSISRGEEEYANLKGKIPADVSPEYALNRKIRLIEEFLWNNHKPEGYLEGIGFLVRITGYGEDKKNRTLDPSKAELGKLVTEFSNYHSSSKRENLFYSVETAPVGSASKNPQARELVHDRCSHSEELYIAFNGQVFGRLEHTEVGNIGRIGFLYKNL